VQTSPVDGKVEATSLQKYLPKDLFINMSLQELLLPGLDLLKWCYLSRALVGSTEPFLCFGWLFLFLNVCVPPHLTH
jgi:hypothetical protein